MNRLIVLSLLLLLGATGIVYASGERRETGDGGERRFSAGDSVLGAFIEFDNNGGQVFQCKIVNSQQSGRVISGVINPWQEELAQMPWCFPPATALSAPPSVSQGCETVNCLPRRASGVGNYMQFHQGEAVIGFRIWIDGRVLTQCYLPRAWTNGTVLDGAANPWRDEVIYNNC